MGRPKLGETALRRHVVTVRLNDGEHEELRRQAGKARLRWADDGNGMGRDVQVVRQAVRLHRRCAGQWPGSTMIMSRPGCREAVSSPLH